MGGEVRDGAIRCFDPRSGALVAEVPCTPAAEVAGVVARAREAGREWAAQPLRRRKAAVAHLHRLFLEHAERVVALLAEECGRPAGEAWTSEVVANHDLFRWWLRRIDDLLTPFPVDIDPISTPGKRGRVLLDPVGVVGLITPWNLPVAIPLRTLVPALLAGNAVVFKPSEHTPRTGALLGELCARALPRDVVQVVQGDGEQGRALVEAAPDRVVFTGGVRTGRAVARLAAERMVPASLELGGKDAAIVLADADLERAAEGIAWAAFALAGQNCAGVERCFVERAVFEEFVGCVAERARRLRPLEDVGPLVTPAQLEVVRRHVADALARGARAVAGGGAPGPGLYHEPTVLVDVTDEMAVMREETFGPVLPVVPVDDAEEAVLRANATEYGLTASIWSRDLDRAEAMAGSLDVGVVSVNDHASSAALPSAAWTGRGASGHGTTNSRFALYELTRPRTVIVASGRPRRETWWFPYNEALVSVARGMVDVARGGARRWPGARAALMGLLHRWKE